MEFMATGVEERVLRSNRLPWSAVIFTVDSSVTVAQYPVTRIRHMQNATIVKPYRLEVGSQCDLHI